MLLLDNNRQKDRQKTLMSVYHPSEMEPMMPPEEGSSELEDLAIELITQNEKLNASLHPITQVALGNMVRNMNCYYSNFIEGDQSSVA